MASNEIRNTYVTQDFIIEETVSWNWMDVAKCCVNQCWVPLYADHEIIIDAIKFIQTNAPDVHNIMRLAEMIEKIDGRFPTATVIMSCLSQEAIRRSYRREERKLGGKTYETQD